MTDTLYDRLRAKCDQFGKDFAAGRLSEMTIAFYHPEAVMEGRDMPAEQGLTAIGHIFEEAREVYSSLTIELEEITQVGDVAFGNFTNRNSIIGGGMDIHRGLMIWTRSGDDWLVVRDFFFSENSPLLSSIGLHAVGGKGAGIPRASRKKSAKA